MELDLSNGTATLRQYVTGPRGEDGLPGVNAVANDTATGTYVATAGSQTRAALDADYSRRTTADARLFGALGNNAVNNTALSQMLTAAKAARRPGTPSLSSDPVGSYVIELPIGDFRISDLRGLLGVENPGSKARGLVFRGQGPGLTNVIFDPATAGALCYNDYWLGLRFEGIRFVAARADCTFMQSYTTNNAQDYTFIDCEWYGWKYGFDLQGNNNNSEYRFFGCATNAIQADGAFLYVGTTSTSDQFLNYWFYGFKHWSTRAPIIDAAKGGHFHFYGVDVSDYANGETTTTRHLFKLRGITHALGVCSITVHGLRVEAKSAKAALLFSEWPQGVVSFYDTDWSSQGSAFTYEDIIEISYVNVNGPTYTFKGGVLAGGVKVSYAVNDYTKDHRILFEGVSWFEPTGARVTPSEVVTYVHPGANLAAPPVVFRDCRHTQYTNAQSGGPGQAVWDCTVIRDSSVATRGAASLSHVQRRSLSVRLANTSPQRAADGAMTFHLPRGAFITGLRVMCPAGNTGSGVTGASWTLATTDGSPVTIVTATVPGALSAGFDVTATRSTPFLCATRAQATVTITATGADQDIAGMMTIEGYW